MTKVHPYTGALHRHLFQNFTNNEWAKILADIGVVETDPLERFRKDVEMTLFLYTHNR